MKRGIIWILLTCLMVASLVLASCSKTTTSSTPASTTTSTLTKTSQPTSTTKTTAPPTTTATTTTATGNWWDSLGTPQYGGEIDIQLSSDLAGFDPYRNYAQFYETPFTINWTLDRQIYNFKGLYVPVTYRKGELATSWEKPDLMTVIFHIREGVYWQDIAPVNGREYTAYDMAFNYQRMVGLGSGFTSPSPYTSEAVWPALTSVTATDKYTVVFKWNNASHMNLEYLMDIVPTNGQVAPEVVKQYGSVQNWRNVVSTGAWIMNDYVLGSSITLTRNPNYWGYDERYTENKLPYADKLKFLIIPNMSTALAGLRTGKIDMVDGISNEQAMTLEHSDPKLVPLSRLSWNCALHMRVDKVPFTDIRVREALQMAIDIPTIAKTYYNGSVDGSIPYGLMGPDTGPFYLPLNTWPKELQDQYIYNPTKAKQLLAEAGYPQGFNTNVVVSSAYDLDLIQILQSYFGNIGVNMQIKPMDPVSYSNFYKSKQQDQMCVIDTTAMPAAPYRCFIKFWSQNAQTNQSNVNDPTFDGMFADFSAASTEAGQVESANKMSLRILEQHWIVTTCPRVQYCFEQPWLKGYSYEAGHGFTIENITRYVKWFWVDQDLKKTS